MPIKHILVVGGAGFIGSHMVLTLRAAGYEVVVLDNLSKGHADAIIDAHFVQGDMGDRAVLNQLFSDYTFDAVMHFASFIEVGESVRKPALYYHNNLVNTLMLLEVMLAYKVKHFIFSSTAAVYGEPQYTPIDEQHPLVPINPYGHSKHMVETILKDYAASYDFHYASLRYFNAAGADPEGRLGERHEPESHLIPLILQVAKGQRKDITVYGYDYPTPDGTCVRDYVHVSDLCQAHLQALDYLQKQHDSIICNLGTGHGYSVQEVIDAARRVTNHAIPVQVGTRRAGDPAILVANADKAKQILNWQPQYAELDVIIQHAWRFNKNQ